MKKSSKCDFKKLALLGIAGGTVLASTEGAANQIQPTTEHNNFSQLLAFNGCGGAQGCHSTQSMGGNNNNSNGNYQAYRNVPSQNYSYSGCQATSAPQYQQTQSSCQAASAQYYQTQSSCHGASAPQYYQSTSGCAAAAQQYYQAPASGCQATAAPSYSQRSTQSGCAAAAAPQYQQTQQSSGCGAVSANSRNTTQPIPQPSNPRNDADKRSAYTQWETNDYTADATKTAPSATTTKQRSLTESELRSQLNEQGKSAYDSLDTTGKTIALKMANQDCKGQNECKGMNSCKTEDHACAGKGSCAGTAKSNFKDKNLAVKVAALKMAEKRANAASSRK